MLEAVIIEMGFHHTGINPVVIKLELMTEHYSLLVEAET